MKRINPEALNTAISSAAETKDKLDRLYFLVMELQKIGALRTSRPWLVAGAILDTLRRK